VRLLTRIWKLADRPCGKLLKPILGDIPASLRRHEAVDETAAAGLLKMSPSTLDRRLRHAKPRGAKPRRREDSLAARRRKIGLKIDTWPAAFRQTPGWIEIDAVAHCGGDMSGSFIRTLNCCDTASGWTEMRPAWNKGAHAVCGAIREATAAFPLKIRGVNTDNGPGFLNAHLGREFPWLCPDALRSRSRPYIKNDNPHVEQKNGYAVRRLPGYGRLMHEETVGALRELHVASSLPGNLYRPTLKLLEKRRENARWVKRFEKEPKTPAQRLLESPDVSDADKQRIRGLLAANDFITLRQRVDNLLAGFIRQDSLLDSRITF
jgi:hypothetical protein